MPLSLQAVSHVKRRTRRLRNRSHPCEKGAEEYHHSPRMASGAPLAPTQNGPHETLNLPQHNPQDAHQ